MKLRLALPLVAIGITFFFPLSTSRAQYSIDLDRATLFSIEWLVDESSVIAVAKFPVEQAESGRAESSAASKPELLRTIKGNFGDLKWPLVMPQEIVLGQHAGPPVGGRIRLLFVRGTSELLQSVKLGRGYDDPPKLWDKWYGITQFGEMLLTESSLYRAVNGRLQAKRDAAPNARVYVDISHDMSVQVYSDRLWLRVPAGLERRDHYLKLLKTGDAAEKVYSIRVLAKMNDAQASDAIRNAFNCDYATPVYYDQGIGGGAWPEELNSESVRKAAGDALKLIEKRR